MIYVINWWWWWWWWWWWCTSPCFTRRIFGSWIHDCVSGGCEIAKQVKVALTLCVVSWCGVHITVYIWWWFF